MTLFEDALAWIFSPDRASGSLPLFTAVWSHLGFTFVAVAIAAIIAIPAGWFVGHTGHGRNAAVALTGAARAIPSFGLVLLLVIVFGVTHKPGAALTAFVVLALPTILAGAYSGISAVPPAAVDGARSFGMTPIQILFRVEVPLSTPLLIGGLRSATLQVLATVTIAGYISNWGLGFYIVQGIQLRDYSQILGASLVIVALALLFDALFALIGLLATPRGNRAAASRQRCWQPDHSTRPLN